MALFRLHKKQWESRLQPLHTVRQSKSGGDSRLELEPGSSPAAEQPRRGEKRKRTAQQSVSGSVSLPQSPSPSQSPSNTLQSLPSSASRALSPSLHLATPSNPSKRKRGSDPTTDPVPRKGVSSGLSTVVRRVGGGKEVKGKGLGRNIPRKGSFAAGGNKKMGTGSGGEKWWTSLGGSGGKKGSIRV
jgi:RNA exonuclease 4